jgi:hypothetical protein
MTCIAVKPSYPKPETESGHEIFELNTDVDRAFEWVVQAMLKERTEVHLDFFLFRANFSEGFAGYVLDGSLHAVTC